MVVLGISALVVAVCAFAGAPVGRLMRRTRVVTCADAVRAEGRVTVFGVVEPLPGGLLHAPVSGRACVWFTNAVVEHWVERDRAWVRDFDGDGPLHRGELRPARRGRGRTEVLSSDRPFLVRDGTGTVVVEPGVLRAVRLPVSARDSVERVAPRDNTVAVDFAPGARRTRRTSRYDRSETVVAPDARVYVSGRVERRPDGGIALTGLTVSRELPALSAQLRTLRARAGWAVGALSGAVGVAALLAGAARPH